MKVLLLLSLLGQQIPDAGVKPNIVPAVRGALLQADGGIVDVGNGTWFSTDEVVLMGKDHAYLRKTNEELEAHAADVPYAWVMGAAITGVVLGGIVGATAARAIK